MITVFQTNFPPQNTPITDSNGAMTNAGMAFLRALYNRTGQATGLFNQVTTGIATNSNAPGTALIADLNLVETTSFPTADVQLPALTDGQSVVVQNSSGFNVIVNPPDGSTIDGVANYTLATSKMQIFWFFSATNIVSTQLG